MSLARYESNLTPFVTSTHSSLPSPIITIITNSQRILTVSCQRSFTSQTEVSFEPDMPVVLALEKGGHVGWDALH